MLKELKEKNFISAVVYVRNNENNIKNFLEVVNNYLKDNFLSYEIICVNDDSSDNSVQMIKEFAKDSDGEIISILNMSYYQGIEQSMHAGVDLSIGDFVYEFDSTTVSYPTELLRQVYDKCLTGFDIVSAYPKSSGHKQAFLFYKFFNKFFDSIYKIGTEAFRILSRRAINRVQSMSDSIPYRKAVYANCGLKSTGIEYNLVKEIPHTVAKEREMQYETAINALILYTDVSSKFAMTLTGIIALCTILATVYTIYTYLTGRPVKGWATTMLYLSFGFFSIISILAILIKYTSLILNIVFRKQKYIIESIEKLK